MTTVIPLIFILAGSMSNILDGSTSLDTKIAGPMGSWNLVVGPLFDDTHTFAGALHHMAGDTSAASQPETRTRMAVPSITSFSAKPRAHFFIGGDSYGVENAGQSYSLTNPDPQTLRFEIRPGDQAWYDSGHSVDRSEVSSEVTIPPGTPIEISYQFMVEPNGPNGLFINTANSYPSGGGFFVIGQMHNDDWSMGPSIATSPPFAMSFTGNHLQIVARYCPPGGNPGNGSGSNKVDMVLWTDPNPIQTGVYNDIKVQANFSNNSSGYLDVWINGKQVVNYHGPLGYGAGTNWDEGLYRSQAPETVAAHYRNLTIATGPSTLGERP